MGSLQFKEEFCPSAWEINVNPIWNGLQKDQKIK